MVWEQRRVEDELASKHMLDAIEEVIPGLTADVVDTRVCRWDPIVIEAPPGYYRRLARFVSERRADSDQRIQLAGDYFAPWNLDSATAAGEQAAHALAKALAKKPSRVCASMPGGSRGVSS